MVTIDELILAINVVLGEASLDRCTSLDVNGDGVITVDEVILAITQALEGCPTQTAVLPIEPANLVVSRCTIIDRQLL